MLSTENLINYLYPGPENRLKKSYLLPRVGVIFPMADPLSHRLWPTHKARSGGHFYYGGT